MMKSILACILRIIFQKCYGIKSFVDVESTTKMNENGKEGERKGAISQIPLLKTVPVL